MSAFERAFDLLIEAEGGFVDDPKDPGGMTKYGISQRAYPNENIAIMTLSRARGIYRRDYWDKISGDSLPEGVALALFDYAVNSGVSQAVRSLQKAVGVTADGVVGLKTLAAIQNHSPALVVAMLSADRILYIAGLPTFSRFGRGWARRIVTTAMETVKK